MTQEKIILETKVQTIYFEDTTGKVDKHFHATNDRLNIRTAKEILEQKGFQVEQVLKVDTQRIGISLSPEELEERISHSESFYKKK